MFNDRQEAGFKLAQKLKEELKDIGGQSFQDTVVLAIPRGGIVIGEKLASELKLPLDVLVTKKIPAPDNPELAVGAVGENGVVFWDQNICKELCLTETYKQKMVAEKLVELESKQEFFRKGKTPLNLKGKTVILTDDGVATGATIQAAIRVAKASQPKEIIVAVPVIALDTLEKLRNEADRVIYLEAPLMFFAVGEFYRNFEQVTDKEVTEILSYQ